MGKIKPRRRRSDRYNPLGIEGSINGEGVNRATVRESPGLNVVAEKIDSAVAEERTDGLRTLAAFALDENALTTIVTSQVIGKVTTLLQDPSAEVRLVAAGALRNVSAGGSDEVVEALVQQDVLPHLAKLLLEYREDAAPTQVASGESTERDMDPAASIFIHATHLLWNLCECSEEALNTFNREGLIHVLLRHLDPSVWGHTLAMAAAECLLCVTENNPSAASSLLPSADSLVSFVSHPNESALGLHFAIIIAGLLLNIDYCTSSGDNFQMVLRVLSKILETNTIPLVTEYASQTPATNGTKPSQTPQDLEHLIIAQQLALEILSNICCPEDDDDDWEECGNGSSEDEVADDSMDTGVEKDVLSPECASPHQVQEGIIHFGLFEKALEKVQYPDENVCQALQSLKCGPSIESKLSALRVRALVSLQNMVSCLDLKEVGGSEVLYSTWLSLGSMVFQNKCTDDSLLEAATGTMRAVMDRLTQDKYEKLANIAEQDLQVIFQGGVSCKIASVRANLARMVGTLGCLIVTENTEERLNGTAMPVLNAATEYLFKVAAHDNKLWVSAEALDVIIDLYSDDKTDKLAHHVRLVERLKGIQPHFKSKHQQQKKQLGEHRALVQTVRDNLTSFIKYKGPRSAKFRHT